MNWKDIPGKYPQAHYEVDVSWRYVEGWLETEDHIDLDPDYQRAHVWTEEQQRLYVEYAMRGGEGGLVLYWNAINWSREQEGNLELVDGKQRLEAVRRFMAGKLAVFDGHCLEDPKELSWADFRFKMRICKLPTRAGVLQWYLAINAGGTPHSEEELSRVRQLLAMEEK